ncbi:MAG: hypothetical protein ACD_15C00204G0023 [uncultured bacterium]|nr:MAG: hypothetical protein ACD_15C00204G0023 [uncultured bacterium]HCU70266.1 endopeptidase La [Candidatus Moranbacteria bacterium]
MKSIKEILNNSTSIYPSITFRKLVFFPGDKVPLVVDGKKFVQSLKSALDADKKIIIIFQKNGDASGIGLIADVLQSWSITNFIMGLFVEGLKRVRIRRTFTEEGVQKSEVEEIEDKKDKDRSGLEALSRGIYGQLKKLIQAKGIIPLTLAEDLQKEHLSPERTSDVVASVLKLSFEERLGFLEMLNVRKRLEKVGEELVKEMHITETEKMIQEKMFKEMDKEKKEMILRQQLKVIEKELGIDEEEGYAELERKIKETNLPEEVEKRVSKELSRLRTMYSKSAEAPYIRTYIDWILEIPWTVKKGGKIDLKKALKVLNDDHYGLDKVKERIIEFLAVQKLTEEKSRGNILCFVGPPGTGKTSVGKSIARALGRNFVRMSLGGLRDEAEIRGHRRTYVGALPGRIIQGMKNAGTKNPVFMLDEIDKMNSNFMGDPAAALLEVLDPEQNSHFADNYIELPYDLSEAFFIATANILDTIVPTLRDRLEVIEFPGYTIDEKFHIAKKYLIPRTLKEYGLNEQKLEFEDSSIHMIIGRYTREAGVRELERKIKEVARKIARKIVEKNDIKKFTITSTNLTKFIGAEEFEITMKEANDEIGVSTALAWTAAGGEIIFVEAVTMPGKGNLILTGQLGSIMKESVRAALSYVRSKSQDWHLNSSFYNKSDIHVHVPSGSVPKDGSSAGIAIVAALASMATKRKVRKEVALTGEVTLSGKILKISGVKEKVLAAHRAGVEIVVMPKENEKNIMDVPESVRKDLKFEFVQHMDEALKIALL